MKKLQIFFLLIILNFAIFAQGDYYWYKGKTQQIEINYNFFYLVYSEKVNCDKVFNYEIELIKEGEIIKDNNKTQYWKILKIKNTELNKEQYRQLIVDFKKQNNIDYVGQVVGKYYPVAVSNFFYVKLKNQNDYTLLNQLAKQEKCKIISPVANMPAWYKLECTKNSNGNSIELSNYFYETGFFENVDPGFMFNFSYNCISDNLFSEQWGLENTSYPNIDINACKAWNITTGSNDVVVAVVDDGILFTHPEFANNLYQFSYDTETETSPAQIHNFDHGTRVAGIIGANQNGTMISGVAPTSLLMSVSISLVVSPNMSEKIASGISWAWLNGADIINNSWGDQGGTVNELHSDLLENAITDALTQGRNGLGSIVVFASGNHAPAIDYPAYFIPEILCVGGIQNFGIKDPHSGYGNELDVVAPGVGILSTVFNNTVGYDSGTSMAAPFVAGIAALILSVNPNLTVQEVNNIIERTARKNREDYYNYENVVERPNGTWNHLMGYGLVDAYKALLSACAYELNITQNINSNEIIFAKAENKITANNTIESGADVIYQAGNKIFLKNGFHAKEGSRFHAYIAPCIIQNNNKSLLIANNDNPEKSNEEINYDEKINNEITKQDNFQIYPNPFNKSFLISLNLSEPNETKIYFTNIYGQKVLQIYTGLLEKGNNQFKISTVSLSPGIYFCILETSSDRSVLKLVKR